MISGIHHIAIICKDYNRSKHFYTEILGLSIIAENFRADRNSWKCDLALGEQYTIELFSFENPPARLSGPEACGLRHLAFSTKHLERMHAHLKKHDVELEEIRQDPYTAKRFFFFRDPDDLPLECYEV